MPWAWRTVLPRVKKLQHQVHLLLLLAPRSFLHISATLRASKSHSPRLHLLQLLPPQALHRPSVTLTRTPLLLRPRLQPSLELVLELVLPVSFHLLNKSYIFTDALQLFLSTLMTTTVSSMLSNAFLPAPLRLHGPFHKSLLLLLLTAATGLVLYVPLFL